MQSLQRVQSKGVATIRKQYVARLGTDGPPGQCDEVKPVCLRCQRTDRACIYVNSPSREGSDSISTSGLVAAGGLSSLSSVTVVPFASASPKKGTSTLHLMHHFRSYWMDILNMEHEDAMILLFQTDVLVRNTILAMTACHLRHLQPGTLPHRIAEHYQQGQAIQHYKRALSTPVEVLGRAGVNSMLLCATLLNMLAFALPEEELCSGVTDPHNSWVFSNNEGRLGWLSMQAGVRSLMKSLGGLMDETMRFLAEILIGVDVCMLAREREKGLTIPKTWLRAFPNDEAHERYRPLVNILAALRTCEPSRLNSFVGLQFLFQLYGGFRKMLFQGDTKALWLFGYWLGLMYRFEGTWWCQARVLRDYNAILLWLERLQLPDLPEPEGSLWAALMEEYRQAIYWPAQ